MQCDTFVCPGTESCIRLIDVDGDGKLDIIFSVARLLNTSIDDLFHDNASQRSFGEICHKRGHYASFCACVMGHCQLIKT